MMSYARVLPTQLPAPSGPLQSPLLAATDIAGYDLFLEVNKCCPTLRFYWLPPPPPDFSAPRTPKAHLWFSSSVRQGNLPTAPKVVQLGWEFSLVIYPGSTPVGNATLVVANVLTCNKYSPIY
jgi:hypothetical protein